MGDFLTFARMPMNGGEYHRIRLVSARSLEEMTTDHLTREQKDRPPFVPGFWDATGCGYGVSGRAGARDEANRSIKTADQFASPWRR